ncbi:hypothetical protein RBU49_14990 [Clostridium sp. MB40-C1]|uniref:hypothetical protein n=1 Tax=Clostridium sp. MB40-C1 TaxID=3070996 RepID=UPI0027E037EB|nr:hypothetical protein [Clostridium sp. MB40-C1]WMJ80118.1 hypothetical protein RBU49_14990 [Clostridium sp. MB40-C1]
MKITLEVPDTMYDYCKRQAGKYFNCSVQSYLSYVLKKEEDRKQRRIVQVYDEHVFGKIDAELVKKLKEKDGKEYWLVDTGIGYTLERWIPKTEIDYVLS